MQLMEKRKLAWAFSSRYWLDILQMCAVVQTTSHSLVAFDFFFIQDEQKAEDEMAKKRAAFLLKQQKKAEETRLRKQQLEAESELKRDEARYFPPS